MSEAVPLDALLNELAGMLGRGIENINQADVEQFKANVKENKSENLLNKRFSLLVKLVAKAAREAPAPVKIVGRGIQRKRVFDEIYPDPSMAFPYTKKAWKYMV
jgi:hypothetical protein